MDIEDKIKIIKKSPIFKNLSKEECSHIAEVAEELKYKKGSIIFEENAQPDGFYIITEGEVEILKRGEDSPEVLAIKGEGDVFGEMSVIDELPRSASIKAKTDIALLKLNKDVFNNLLNSFSHISLEIARSICQTVRATNINYIKDLEKRNRQLKFAYKRLKNTQEELIRLEKLSVIGKFASFIIHDIKNPMTNVRAYAELMQMNEPGNPSVQKSSKIIIDEVDRLNNMVMELLEFSRGDLHIAKTPVNISALISTMIDTVKADLKKKDIDISYQSKTDSIVMIDLDKIKRVFYNLINNSRDAILKDGKIFIKVEEEEKWIKWSIQDNGIGMEAEVLEKIFEPFYSKNKKSGTGLGMTIVKSIIESHGGHIKVFSIKDTGTRFDIFLPKA